MNKFYLLRLFLISLLFVPIVNSQDDDTEEVVVKIDPRYFRPTEVEQLLGDPTKAKTKLNWKPQISISKMISEMIELDSKEAEKEVMLKRKGFEIYGANESP